MMCAVLDAGVDAKTSCPKGELVSASSSATRLRPASSLRGWIAADVGMSPEASRLILVHPAGSPPAREESQRGRGWGRGGRGPRKMTASVRADATARGGSQLSGPLRDPFRDVSGPGALT